MNRTIRHFLGLALVFAMLALPTFAVQAKELGSLTITGPGIKGELTLNDPKAMMHLEETGFFDQASLSQAPDGLNLEAGYTINAQLNLDGKLVPFVQMVYYPTREGEPGYVHVTGRLQGETLKQVDEWSHIKLTADTAFRELMSTNNVVLQSALVTAAVKAQSPAEPAGAVPAAEPASAPVAKPAAPPLSSLALSIAALIVIVAGAGLLLRQRTAHSAG